MRAHRWMHGLTFVALLGGCGEPKVDSTIAKAMETKSEMEVAAAKVSDRQHAEAQKAQALRDAQAAARKAELVAAAKLPATLPASLETACGEFVTAYDEFMKKGAEKDVLEWWDGHRKKLGEARGKCLARESIEVAACGTSAFAATLPTLDELARPEAARVIVETCIEVHGGEA